VRSAALVQMWFVRFGTKPQPWRPRVPEDQGQIVSGQTIDLIDAGPLEQGPHLSQ